MGITRVLVKSVFSKNKHALSSQDSSVMSSNGASRKRWSSVRSYLCGHEFNSVNAEVDSASVNGSEASITQPLREQLIEKDNNKESESIKENVPNSEKKSISTLFHEENAAIIIQSAFRDYLGRRQRNEKQSEEDKKGDEEEEEITTRTETDSPGRNSLGTSIEAQTGNSVDVLSVSEESVVLHRQGSQKARALVFRIKKQDDWDDSTVSSNISKRRYQNRLEAMTRRERALAYAFSQQLRICSKKRPKSDGAEPNMGWSWLERWMATRLPESLPVESKQHDNNQKFMVRKSTYLDMAGEEKESCGSNEVSVHLDGFSTASKESEQDRAMHMPKQDETHEK
ncbi:hypothetical protein ACFE04_016991 [Oxalis oulophora]